MPSLFAIGEHAGFDENAPTSRSGGKAVAINLLKTQHGYKNLVLIGDGATDLEASPPAAAFIGEDYIIVSVTIVRQYF